MDIKSSHSCHIATQQASHACNPGSLAAYDCSSPCHSVSFMCLSRCILGESWPPHRPKKATRPVASTNSGQPFSLTCSGSASQARAIAAAVSSVCTRDHRKVTTHVELRSRPDLLMFRKVEFEHPCYTLKHHCTFDNVGPQGCSVLLKAIRQSPAGSSRLQTPPLWHFSGGEARSLLA